MSLAPLRIPMTLRLALLSLVVAAAPAAAQSQFIASCMTSAGQSEGALTPEQNRQICECSAAQAMSAGVDAGQLDGMVTYVDESGSLDLDGAPDEIQQAGATVMSSTLGCALQIGMAAMMTEMAGGITEALAEPGAATTTVAADPAAPVAPPPPAVLPTGLRTGNGTGPVRTQRSGTGSAIRITG